jgi:hypothetical protein
MFDFLKRLFSRKPKVDPLWINVPAGDPYSDAGHGMHSFEFVPRQSIAETGLHCPLCKNEVCPLGDYRLVRHCRLGDVVRCNGTRQVNDEDLPCPAYLVASPNTEIGDHLIYDATPQAERMEKFHRFLRISEEEAAKLKHGKDAVIKDGEVFATTVPVKAAEKKKLIPLGFQSGQTWQTDDGRQVFIVRVQNTPDDKTFDGWGWGTIAGEEAYEWHIDPAGFLRQSMRDPTARDRGRLVTELRPV